MRQGAFWGGDSSYQRCYETHKPLSLGNGLVVYGGSCGHPVIHDADVYVGLDYTMDRDTKSFPWNDRISVQFLIPDMGVPSDVAEFKKMITWLSVQLTAKKKVHIGCIGGHGRTGTVLAALVKEMMGIDDAITYVRENYCQKAVESESQVRFLNEHYGISKVASTKGTKRSALTPLDKAPTRPATKPPAYIGRDKPTGSVKATAVPSSFSIWGGNFLIDKRP